MNLEQNPLSSVPISSNSGNKTIGIMVTIVVVLVVIAIILVLSKGQTKLSPSSVGENLITDEQKQKILETLNEGAESLPSVSDEQKQRILESLKGDGNSSPELTDEQKQQILESLNGL